MVRRRVGPPAVDGVVLEGVADDWFCERLPELHHFLVDMAYDDGSPREPGALTLFRGEVALQGCLSDKDTGLVTFVSAVSYSRVLEALEAGLVGDRLDWRRSKPKKR